MNIEGSIQQRRLARLNQLIDEYGGQAELAHEVDVTPGYISQLVTERKKISEHTVRKIEDSLNLSGWVDQDNLDLLSELQTKKSSDLPLMGCSIDTRKIISMIVKLDREEKLDKQVKKTILLLLSTLYNTQ